MDPVDYANAKEVEILVTVYHLQVQNMHPSDSTANLGHLMQKLGSLLADCGKEPYLRLCETQPGMLKTIQTVLS